MLIFVALLGFACGLMIGVGLTAWMLCYEHEKQAEPDEHENGPGI